MQEMIKLFIGIIVLAMGIPLGNLLAKSTTEEQRKGKRWFKILLFASSFGGIVGLIIQNDILMFSLFFIAIVTSCSLKNGKKS